MNFSKAQTIFAAMAFALASLSTTLQAQKVEWIRQFGHTSNSTNDGVSADGLGNIYAFGWTKIAPDGTNAGSYDASVTKYDAAGMPLWTKPLGTTRLCFIIDICKSWNIWQPPRVTFRVTQGGKPNVTTYFDRSGMECNPNLLASRTF